MKKLVTKNQALLEALEENGIKTICTNNMDVVISDEDAERISAIVDECAPAALQDYCLEDVEIPNLEYKKLILAENYEQSESQEQFSEWVEDTASSDPSFFRWLFEIDNLEDFENPSELVFQSFICSANKVTNLNI